MASGYGTTKPKSFRLGGGLDLVTDAISIRPGRALAMMNYEPYFGGGYRRCPGFERFDGRERPSDATYLGFDVSSAAGLSIGDFIEVTSGGSGFICGIDGLHIALTKTFGVIAQGDVLTTGNGSTITNTPTDRQAPDAATDEEFLLGAQDYYRSLIGQVPGSGPVQGVWRRQSTVYAWRAGTMYRASASGWTTSGITMCKYLYFDAGGAGTSEPLPEINETVTGATSGATAFVHRVVEHGGAVGTNDAFGYLVLRGGSGTFQDNETLRVGGVAFATAASASATYAFTNVGGEDFRFVNHNFFGGSSTYRTYGVLGSTHAFEIDESHRVSPILLPQSDTSSGFPYLIAQHRNHLFLAFDGGRIAHSVIGEPIVFNGLLGAAEFGMGAELTGMQSVAGNVLVLTTDGFTKGLYGNDVTDWDLKLLAEKTGAKEHGLQLLDTAYSLDDLGITTLARVQSFGDFAGATVSQVVQPLIDQYRDRITDSVTTRQSSSVRFFFDDGLALVMHVRAAGAINIDTGGGVDFGVLSYPVAPSRLYASEDENGVEHTYFATTNATYQGYVFEDRIGPSFDGEEIKSYIRLAFNHLGSPGYRKRMRRADFEITTDQDIDLRYVHDVSYGSAETARDVVDLTSVDDQVSLLYGGGNYADVEWAQFVWDGENTTRARADLNGTGEALGLLLLNESATARPYILKSTTVHFDPRRLQR